MQNNNMYLLVGFLLISLYALFPSRNIVLGAILLFLLWLMFLEFTELIVSSLTGFSTLLDQLLWRYQGYLARYQMLKRRAQKNDGCLKDDVLFKWIEVFEKEALDDFSIEIISQESVPDLSSKLDDYLLATTYKFSLKSAGDSFDVKVLELKNSI